MKLRLMCMFVVAVVLTSNLAFADIVYWGRTFPRSNNASVSGDWEGATVEIDVDGTPGYGWGRFLGMCLISTTEAGYFTWGSEFQTHAWISVNSQHAATAWAYGEAWATGPASDSMTLTAATASVSYSGTGSYFEEAGPYPSWASRPSTYFAANDYVETGAGAEAQAEVLDYSTDVASCYGFAYAQGWIQ